MSAESKSKRIFYFDALRALAILSVITFHVFGCTNGLASKEFIDGPTLNWFINAFLGSNKIGVDLFLMLSGALSLGRQWDIRTFLIKRFSRITAPFLFWGFVLGSMMFFSLILRPEILSEVILPIESATVGGFLSYLYDVYMAVNPGTSQFWFFWMILGTYLIMPVLNKWFVHSDLCEAEYFLFFWLIACIFQDTLGFAFPNYFYFAGTVGLVVLGYYLRHTERRILNSPYFALFLTFAGLFSSIFVMYINFTPGDIYTTYNGRLSVYVVCEVIGIFLLFKNFSKFNLNLSLLSKPFEIFKKGVFSVARYSYGMYLNHIFIMLVLMHYFFDKNASYMPTAAILIAATFFISWLVMALLSRVAGLRDVVGAK